VRYGTSKARRTTIELCFPTCIVVCMISYMLRREPPSASPPRPGPATGRGITAADVDRAADALLRAGERPTIEKVRLKIGRGSPNTINPLLDRWWSRLAARLDAGPAALHRLPEPVLHAAEGLWLTALDEARRRAQLESGSSRKALARERQDLEVQAHILSIREQELKDRLAEADRRTARLELELEALTTLLRKEQASRLASERRLAESQSDAPRALSPRRGRSAPSRTPARRKAKSRKPVKKTRRTSAPTKRTVAMKRSRNR
jgi:hypothetical protein